MIAGTILDMMSAVITGITDMTLSARLCAFYHLNINNIGKSTHWHYPGDDPRQPSEMIDHQNHSRADHHDGAPGTIPMTIRALSRDDL